MVRAHPYRRPPSDVLRPGPWARVVADGTVELHGAAPDWDYETVLELNRQITVDGARARSACGLGSDAVLALTVRWTASASLLRGRAWQQRIDDVDDRALDLTFELPGTELGGSLELHTLLTVLDAGSAPAASAPRRPGSIIWSDSATVDLLGDGIRFPIALGDFADLVYPTDAAWHVEIGTALDAAARGTVLLVVNRNRPAVVDALRNASAPSPEQASVLSALRTGVLRGLIERAVTDPAFDLTEKHQPGTLGGLLSALLEKHMSDTDLESLRREREQEPEMFASRVQAAARLFVLAR
jgi:hypothetical protein